MASVDFLEAGLVVGGFRVGRLIGRGGMGVVYEATQLALDRPVALKVLAAHLGDDPQFRERFRREGVAQASLDHPHIVPIYEAGEAAGKLYIAMRLIRGSTLKSLIEHRELTAKRTLQILAQVAEALDAAHARGLVHRDFKPQNVLVETGDTAFLADFGLTRTASDGALTAVGQHLGTPLYTAPEQVRGQSATARTDVYALAAVLFECVTGTAPYIRESDSAVLFAHLYEPPPRPSDRLPDLPEALDTVIARGMAKQPDDRHASAWEVVSDAANALRLAHSEETRFVPLPVAPSKNTKLRTTAAAFAVALVAIAAATGLAVGYSHPRADATPAAGPQSPAVAADVRRINAAIQSLNAVRVRERRRIALTAKSEVGAAGVARISRAYGQAARALTALPLVRSLDRAARAYRALSKASNRSSYTKAVAAVGRAEATVSRELAALP